MQSLFQHDTLTDAQRRDTELDFAKENSSMADIYEGSYFTISADISTSMDSGMFSNNSPPACLPVKVVDDNGKPVTLFARTRKLSHGLWASGINTRSWTLQEHILPPRVLHFGQYDISWRCRKLHICECGYVNNPDRILNGFCERQSKVARELSQLYQPAFNVVEWWETVIESYSHRSLSEPRDKLPALSGLAQVYRKATMDTYLAGLWRGWLLYGLCWGIRYRTYPKLDKFAVGCRPKTFRAPSWSWASIDISRPDFECQIYSCFVNGTDIKPKAFRIVCMLHQVYCTPKTSDPTGEVSEDCRLEIGVKLVSVTIKRLRCQSTSPQWAIYNVKDGTEVQYLMPDCRLEDEGLSDGDEVFCAPIMESLDHKYSVRRCILLKRLQGQTYQRIGFCVLLKENPNVIEHEELKVDAWQLGQESPVPLSEEIAKKTKDYALQFDVDMLERIVII
ncbi:hypothetical protein F53441_3711 [Fusarium austroafricanum]|uniref:Heterokaryon incompatibility domain-containing protein n=1 Tax=Fusarium austroafricanum TaxID=2364996 RepID=A0A8H4KNY0_9HYPO|nr:hypothetical protein F53441_3711 [Fusarium austroafricanum]